MTCVCSFINYLHYFLFVFVR
jgi:di-N-acetylchitobiase